MRLGFRYKFNCKFLLKNTTHYVIICGVSLQIFPQLLTLSEQRRKSKLCRTVLKENYNWHDGNKNNFKNNFRTIIVIIQNFGTTSLGQNLQVLIKVRVFGVFLIGVISYCCCLMSTFKNKNSLRTIEVQIVKKLKNNEARPKFTGSY